VHKFRLRKADSPASEPLAASAQSEVFTFDALSVLFAHSIVVVSQVTVVRPPVVSVENGDTKRGEQLL